MSENDSKAKQELLEDYKITKQWLDLYEPFYSTYLIRQKRNEEIEDELFYRFDTIV